MAGKDYIRKSGMSFITDTYGNYLPQLKNKKMYVPIDFIIQKFGGKFLKGYYYTNKKIKIKVMDQITVEYTAGSKTMVVNGKKVSMTLAPTNYYDDEMFVELDSFVKSVAGMKILYDGNLAIIYPTDKKFDMKNDKAAIDKIKQIF